MAQEDEGDDTVEGTVEMDDSSEKVDTLCRLKNNLLFFLSGIWKGRKTRIDAASRTLKRRFSA